jgi:hypothetical protein
MNPAGWPARRQKKWFTGPLARGIRWLTVLGEEPARSPEDHCGPAVWPAHGLSTLSRISRNSGKLLRVLEFLLAHKARILTTNYLITCKKVWVRRHDLVKPDSVHPMNGFRNLSGVSGSHRKTVESYIHHVTQVKA